METAQKQITPDSVISCLGFLFFVLFAGLAAWIFLAWQIIPWLHEGAWHSYPISHFFTLSTSWMGFQLILDWLLALPVTLLLAFIGLLLFRVFGILSAKLYQAANKAAGSIVTPSQTRA